SAARDIAASHDPERSALDSIAARLTALEQRMEASAGDLVAVIGEHSEHSALSKDRSHSNGVLAGAEAVAASAERLATAAIAALQANAVRRAVPHPATPTARERLKSWTADNAIFFANNSDYRDPATAERQLDELAVLIKQSRAFVRVVGYTDE